MSEIEQQIAYLRKRAYFLYEHGQYDRAASVADQVFRLTKQYRGEKHFDVAASLGDLATAFLAMSNFQGARAAMHEAIGILRELPGKEFQGVLAINLEKLAELHNRLGDAAAAAKALQESIDILRTTLGPNHPVVSMSLLNLAELYFRQDDHIAAELLFREGFELAGSTLDKTHPAVALSLGDFAEIYVRRGDYLAAEPLLRDTVELIGRVGGEEDPEYAQSLNNLAILYHEMGDYAKAEPLLNQALKIRENVLGEHSPAVATSLNNLAVLYLSKNLFPAAFMYAQRALEIWRGSRQEQHPKYAMALANLAHSYEQMVPYIHGAYQEAAALYTAARGIVRNTHGEDHPFYATALQDLARLHFSQGDYGSAELLYREVAEIDKKGLGKNHPHYATDLCDLAMTLAATKRASEAMQMFKDAAVVKDHAIAEIFSFGSESQRMAYVATLHAQLNASLSLVVDHLAYSSADVKTALEWVLRRKAIGVEAIAVQRDAVLGGRYPELATRLQELTRLRMQIARKILNGPGAADLDLYRGQLDEWDKQKEEHEKELAEHIPEMRIEQQLRSVDCQKVAATLPAGSALVEFVRFDLFDFDAVPGRREEQWKPPRYLAFVVLAEAPEDIRLVCLGDAAQIDKLIGRFRRVLTGEVMQDRDKGKIIAISTTTPASCERDPSAMRDTIKAVRRLQNMRALIEDTAEVSEPRAAELEAEVRQVGAEVRHAVFDPLLAALHGHTRLFLAPDGDLNRLPFEVLPLDDGRYSIDEYQFSYLTTGRDLLRFSVPVRGKPLPPLVVADPDFALSVTRSRRAIMPFRRLKGTHAEATGLAVFDRINGVLPHFA